MSFLEFRKLAEKDSIRLKTILLCGKASKGFMGSVIREEVRKNEAKI